MPDPDAKLLLREAMDSIGGLVEGLGTMDEMLPPLTMFLDEFAASGFECAMCALPPTPEVVYPGVEGVQRGWTDFSEMFEGVRADLQEIRESPRGLVVLVNQVARTRTGGVEISQPSAMAFLFDAEGRVARLEFHLDQQAALRSAGIGP